MSHLVRSILIVAGASVLAAGRVEASPDVLEAVIASGTNAGTYQTPGSELICMNSPANNMYVASWADQTEIIEGMYGTQGKSKPAESKALHSASIRVLNPNDPGAKLGDVSVEIRDPSSDKQNGSYKFGSVPITLTIKGKGADISFQGKTKDGIELRVTAKCSEMVQM